jgi:H+/Cl- antiporter ClcA
MSLLIFFNYIIGIMILAATPPDLFKLPVKTKQDMIERTTFWVIGVALGFVGWVLLLIFAGVRDVIREFNSLPWREK